MRYILAIGIETSVYKNPKLELYLNDRLIDLIELTDNSLVDVVPTKKIDIMQMWHPLESANKPDDLFFLHKSKKWLLFELDDSILKNNNVLEIKHKELKSNYTNGFVTRADECRIHTVLFLPKIFFGVDNIKNIFEYCTERNIVADLALHFGWPTGDMTMYKINFDHRHHSNYAVGHNINHTFKISYDEKMEMHVLYHEINKVHHSANQYKELTKRSYIPVMTNMQNTLIPNNNSSVLNINAQTIFHFKHLQDKYQCYENQ